MLDSGFFVLLFFGAPAGIISLLLAALGIWRKKPLVLIIAGVWAIPATYYISAGTRLPFYLTALFLFGAAYAVYQEKIRTAWLLLIPFVPLAVWMTVFTLINIFSS